MNQCVAAGSGNARCPRRAMAAVMMIVVLLVIDVVIVGLTLSAPYTHQLTVRRLETVQAMYAAEAGVNMSVREMMEFTDEDADGAVGSISDDGDDGTDPTFGEAQVVVTLAADTPVAGQSTLTSAGRSGVALRKITTILE